MLRKKGAMKFSTYVLVLLTVIFVIGCATRNGIDPEKIQTLANPGDVEAQNDLGSMYQFGDGVPQDYQKSVNWYKKAATQGSSLAKVNLGYMYDLGLGVSQNKEKAIVLYSEAANAGEPRGMINLAEMYRKGNGIEQSNDRAYMWLEIARFYTQRTKDMEAKWAARGALYELKKQMTKSQIRKGEILASEWIEKNK